MAYTPTKLADNTATSGAGTTTLYTTSTGQKVILSQAELAMSAANSGSACLYIERASSGTQATLLWLVNATTGVACGIATDMLTPATGNYSLNVGLPVTLPAATASIQGGARSIKGIVLEAGDMLKLVKATASSTHHVSVSGVVIS